MLENADIVINGETSEVSVVTFVPDGPQQIPVGLFSISDDHPVRRALEVGQKVLDRIPEESEIGYIYPANDINKPGLGMVIVELRPKPEPRPITGPAYLESLSPGTCRQPSDGWRQKFMVSDRGLMWTDGEVWYWNGKRSFGTTCTPNWHTVPWVLAASAETCPEWSSKNG